MDRRTLLRSLGAGSALLAGCIGRDGGGTTPTGTATPQERRVTDRSFEVREVDCGTGEHDATIAFGESRVTVDGVIAGPNPCYTAELEAATYDADRDRLTVAVRSYLPEENEDRACLECVADIEYGARVEFEGGTPGTVVVTHDGERVARRER